LAPIAPFAGVNEPVVVTPDPDQVPPEGLPVKLIAFAFETFLSLQYNR
jgi:hypothetical protein